MEHKDNAAWLFRDSLVLTYRSSSAVQTMAIGGLKQLYCVDTQTLRCIYLRFSRKPCLVPAMNLWAHCLDVRSYTQFPFRERSLLFCISVSGFMCQPCNPKSGCNAKLWVCPYEGGCGNWMCFRKSTKQMNWRLWTQRRFFKIWVKHVVSQVGLLYVLAESGLLNVSAESHTLEAHAERYAGGPQADRSLSRCDPKQ